MELEVALDLRERAGAVVKGKAIPIGGEHEGDVEDRGIVERLLKAGIHFKLVVLGFDYRDGAWVPA